MKAVLVVNGKQIEIDIEPRSTIDETARVVNMELAAHGVFPHFKALTEVEVEASRKESEERLAAHRVELVAWFGALRLFDRMDLLDTMCRKRDVDATDLSLDELDTMHGLMQPASY